ncbi:hypothetical protein GJ496_009224 [Pomphorhynchus laevis]|nr:hypothetical protein GJ496_009224 [Pomphorhynchus laevis]
MLGLILSVAKHRCGIIQFQKLSSATVNSVDMSKSIQIDLLSYKMTEIPIIISGEQYNCDHQLYRVCPYDHTKLVSRYSVAPESLVRLAFNRTKSNSSNHQSSFTECLSTAAVDLIVRNKKTQIDLKQALVIGQGRLDYEATRDGIEEASYLLKSVNVALKQFDKNCPLFPRSSVIVYFSSYISSALSSMYAYLLCSLGYNLVWIPDKRSILHDYSTTTHIVVSIRKNSTVIPVCVVAANLFFKILLDIGVPASKLSFIPTTFQIVNDVLETRNIPALSAYPLLNSKCSGTDLTTHYPGVVESIINLSFWNSGQFHGRSILTFVPRIMYKEFCSLVQERIHELKFGVPTNPEMFGSAVVDKRLFNLHQRRLYQARASANKKVWYFRDASAKIGYFVYPAFVQLLSTDWSCLMPFSYDSTNVVCSQSEDTPFLYFYVYEDSDFWITVKHVKNNMFLHTGAYFNLVSRINLYCSNTCEYAFSENSRKLFLSEFSSKLYDQDILPVISINEYELPSTKCINNSLNTIISDLTIPENYL